MAHHHELTWTYTFAQNPEAIWDFISDTERLNRMVGLASVCSTDELQADGTVRRMCTGREAGFDLLWQEHPYQWVRHEWFKVLRTYLKGPLRAIEVSWKLAPVEAVPATGATGRSGCRVSQSIRFEARNPLLALVAWTKIRWQLRARFLRAYAQIDQALAKAQAQGALPEAARVMQANPAPAVGTGRLEQTCRQLREDGVGAAVVEHLVEHLALSDDVELARIRPFKLADAWGIDRTEVLRGFLSATVLGVTDLHWAILCPSCRGAKNPAPHLHDIPGQGHCPSCRLEFAAEFDRSVELSFRVNPSFRKIDLADYCVGSPGRTPHYLVQAMLEPGAKTAVEVNLPAGAYRIRRLGSTERLDVMVNETAPGSLAPAAFAFPAVSATGEEASATASASAVELAPGRALIRFANPAGTAATYVLETAEWLIDACPASFASSLPEFRTQFSSEVLADGIELTVGHMTILFTDLLGSTAMYRTIGDAQAFRKVREHFKVLERVIGRHHGAVVKTIGDAIMASFPDPSDAVRAALAIQDEVEEIGLGVKCGVHGGPCYATTLNERLDYFGSTVNVAARLTSFCRAGETVITAALAADPRLTGVLAAQSRKLVSIERPVKGFDDPVAMICVAAREGSVYARESNAA